MSAAAVTTASDSDLDSEEVPQPDTTGSQTLDESETSEEAAASTDGQAPTVAAAASDSVVDSDVSSDEDAAVTSAEEASGGTNVGVELDADPMCFGDSGVVPSCDGIAMSEFDEFQASQCEGASTVMKPGVAAQFVQCILDQSSAQLDDPINTYDCKRSVLFAACPDPDARFWCDAMLAYCPGESDECLSYMNGLSEAGVDAMLSCAESDCFDVWSCVEGL